MSTKDHDRGSFARARLARWRSLGRTARAASHIRQGVVWSAPIVLLVLGTMVLVNPTMTVAAQESGPPRFGGATEPEFFDVSEVRATRALVRGNLKAEGYETHWRIEYATLSSGPWVIGVEGVRNPPPPGAENETGSKSGELTQLSPSTKYFTRMFAHNSQGSVTSKTVEFDTTAIGRPEFTEKECTYNNGDNLCSLGLPGTRSVAIHTVIESDGATTTYHCEYSGSESGPWTAVSGGSGSITVAEEFAEARFTISGLTPETTYYVRCEAQNAKGVTIALGRFVTHTIKPEVTLSDSLTFSSITASAAHVTGAVRPNTYETHWHFEYATSKTGPWTAVAGGSGVITQAEADETFHPVEATLSGLAASTLYYVRLQAESENGSVSSETGYGVTHFGGFHTGGPPVARTFAVHALDGESMRVLGAVTPNGYDTHDRAQYATQQQFEEHGWAGAAETPEVDAGSGEGNASTISEGRISEFVFVFYPSIVGVDLPSGLKPGVTYHVRLVASNGQGTSFGDGQTLTVPAVSEGAGGEACPNANLRSGLSGHLPDCRAYEQVTPVNKEGAIEILKYGAIIGGPGAVIGEDGEHVAFNASLTKWGSGQGPYVFSRDPEKGWQMTAGQPEGGVSAYRAELYSPDLRSVALQAGWEMSEEVRSPKIEFKVGPPGGPYSSIAVPRSQVPDGGGWVASSEDLSTLVLAVEDRELVEHRSTGTLSGSDLYQYGKGELQQVNVLSDGSTIGSCGATIAMGEGETSLPSARHAVSADGSRVFFQAAPGSNCSVAKHLYMRADGTGTVDLGAYAFVAANRDGSRLLLEGEGNGGVRDFTLYDVPSQHYDPLFSLRLGPGAIAISEDFNAIYVASSDALAGTQALPIGPKAPFGTENLYRYDVPAKTLTYLLRMASGGMAISRAGRPSPDGRYDYFESPQVAAVPGGRAVQVYRLDSAQDVVECVSCASSYDPQPRLGATLAVPAPYLGVAGEGLNGTPQVISSSDNGDFVFFATAAALLPQDVDGEVAPEEGRGAVNASNDGFTSISSDVYEWRALGVYGCGLVQGCISLITPGTGGEQVTLLGTTHSGRDVFFHTHSSLLPRDNDTAGDYYDARIGGGFPEPVRPTECEGDACISPVGAPIDTTPASLSFSGPGNLVSTPLAKAKAKPKSRPCSKRGCKRRNRKGKARTRGHGAAARSRGRVHKHGRGSHK